MVFFFPPEKPCMIVSHHTAWAFQSSHNYGSTDSRKKIETFAYSIESYRGIATCKSPLCLSASSIAFLHNDKSDNVSAMKHLHRTSACFRSRANLEPLSTPLQHGIRFFQHPKPAHLRNALRLSLIK